MTARPDLSNISEGDLVESEAEEEDEQEQWREPILQEYVALPTSVSSNSPCSSQTSSTRSSAAARTNSNSQVTRTPALTPLLQVFSLPLLPLPLFPPFNPLSFSPSHLFLLLPHPSTSLATSRDPHPPLSCLQAPSESPIRRLTRLSGGNDPTGKEGQWDAKAAAWGG